MAFPDICLAFHTNGVWTIDKCAELGGGYYMTAPGTKCARMSKGWQGIIGGAFADIPQPLTWSCKGGNPSKILSISLPSPPTSRARGRNCGSHCGSYSCSHPSSHHSQVCIPHISSLS